MGRARRVPPLADLAPVIDAAEIAAIAEELARLQRRLAAALDGEMQADAATPTQAPVADEWAPTKVAADLAGVSRDTLRRYAARGLIRKGETPTGAPRYHAGDCRALRAVELVNAR
jgi:MerR HTH family regulatory protein